MTPADDELFLRHIAEAIEKIERYTAVGRERFLAESHWQDATIRQLEIIGEAVKRLSQTFKDRYQEIPWRRIAGMRDVLIHNYMGVDLAAVWQVTQEHIPALAQTVRQGLDSS